MGWFILVLAHYISYVPVKWRHDREGPGLCHCQGKGHRLSSAGQWSARVTAVLVEDLPVKLANHQMLPISGHMHNHNLLANHHKSPRGVCPYFMIFWVLQGWSFRKCIPVWSNVLLDRWSSTDWPICHPDVTGILHLEMAVFKKDVGSLAFMGLKFWPTFQCQSNVKILLSYYFHTPFLIKTPKAAKLAAQWCQGAGKALFW